MLYKFKQKIYNINTSEIVNFINNKLYIKYSYTIYYSLSYNLLI